MGWLSDGWTRRKELKQAMGSKSFIEYDNDNGSFTIYDSDGNKQSVVTVSEAFDPRGPFMGHVAKNVVAEMRRKKAPDTDIAAVEERYQEIIRSMEEATEDRINQRVLQAQVSNEVDNLVAQKIGEGQTIISLLQAGMETRIKEAVEASVAETRAFYLQQIAEMEERVKASQPVIVLNEGIKHEITESTHQAFPDLLRVVGTGWPVMMVGPAGSGKTTAAFQVSKALGLAFYSISVGMQTSKTDLVGYMNGHGTYVGTQFRNAYEHGGVFLMDEIDAGNPNVLIVLNSAISANFAPFPDGMVMRHPDFRFVSTANTYGMGANRQYVGRNQIDAATLDRFISLDWPIDTTLEALMVSPYEQGPKWHTVVQACRSTCEQQDFRVVVSPRATLKGVQLLEGGMPFENVVRMVITPTAGVDQAEILMDAAKKAWR